MTNTQGANSKGEAEPRDLKDVAENKISDKDVLVDSALDDVSGGAWPNSTTKTTVVPPTI